MFTHICINREMEEFMIKAIFFDVDGTLISKDNPRISNQVIEALNKLREKGIKLFIASGRHYLELGELGINDQFTFDGYLTLNGGYCFNHDEVIYKNPIHRDDVRKIVDFTTKHNLACSFVEGDDLYINLINDLVVKAQEAINTSLPPVKDILRALDNDVYQIDPFVDEAVINEIVALTKYCKHTQWHDGAYDIIPIKGGKQEGISAIIKYYGFDVSETMAFGDGHNDIDMLKFVGTGVCMANGHEKTKEISDYITNHVDEGGIVKALQYFNLL